MNKRTVRDFTFDWDVFPIVDDWAQRTGYRVQDSGPGWRLMKRGSGFWVAATMAQVHQNENHVHLEAWVKVDILTRIFSLFILPAEMDLDPGAVRAAIPRSVGREKINLLLGQLRQPPIL